MEDVAFVYVDLCAKVSAWEAPYVVELINFFFHNDAARLLRRLAEVAPHLNLNHALATLHVLHPMVFASLHRLYTFREGAQDALQALQTTQSSPRFVDACADVV